MGDPVSDVVIDPDSPVGVAAQVRDRIALLIADGILQPGDRLPPLRELASRLGINVNTLRVAYARLESEGLLQTRHGVGTTVADVDPGQLAAVTWRGRSNSIGVLIAALDPFYAPVLRAIEAVVAQSRTLVAIADAGDSSEHAAHALRQLTARGVDGLIAISLGELPPSSTRGRDRLPPIVYVDQPDRTGHVIVFDTDHAGELATRHLLDEGRQRVALLEPSDAFPNVAGLRTGYERTLDAYGRAREALVVEVDGFDSDSARAAMVELLEGPRPPDGLVTASGTHALVALTEARTRGFSLPHDLAVVGYGDSEPTQLTHPALTMIELPTREAGTLAARILQDLIARRPREPERHVLASRLVVRASCGPHQ